MTPVSKTTSDQIADQLREEILRGRVKSRESIRQSKIADQFGVSPIPVREALVQLSTEGLVYFLPNRGAFVAQLSTAELQEIYTLRKVLEPFALTEAIPHLTEEELVRCGRLLDALDREKDSYDWGMRNWEFHATLYQAAGMPHLDQMIRGLHLHVIRYIMNHIPNPRAIETETNHRAEHRAILDACRAGDGEIGAILLRRHLDASYTILTRLHQQSQPAEAVP